MNEKLILVVDDSKFLCTMLQKAFDSVGYNTLVAYTIEEGLALFEASRPDLLLLDINLPDRPGPQACREIKANPQYNSTSVILMSGSYEDYIKQQVAESGADGYIRKPFSPGSILSWVRENSQLLFNDSVDQSPAQVVSPVTPPSSPAPQVLLPSAQSVPLQDSVAQMLEKAVPSVSSDHSSRSNPELCDQSHRLTYPVDQRPSPLKTPVDSRDTHQSVLNTVKNNTAASSSTPDFFGQNLSIIITDDSTFLCAILKDTLEKVGFKVNTFPNIRETGLYLRENKADLLFLDINLPDISGNRACQIIKESPITANLPIVLISGAQEEQLKQLTIASGANGFITKPFTPMTVLTWLKDNSSRIFPQIHCSEPQNSCADNGEAPLPTSAIGILIDQLSSSTRAVKLAACYSLGEFQAKEAVGPLLKLLSDTGFFPAEKFEVYKLENEDLFLVGTSEVPLASLHSDDTLDASELPLRYAGYSTCFRKEAGAYGKDTRGIFRVHQFDKMEMFSFCDPEKSYDELEFILETEKEIMDGLGLYYRVINIAASDLGNPAAKKYDIEAWIPSQEKFRELTSCSNCTDFQARRLGVRMKDGKKKSLVHTLNGTAVAIGRMLIAIMETHQLEDGSIKVPEVLRPFLPGQRDILSSR